MKRHLLILYICLFGLILGTGLEISGITTDEWFIKEVNSSSDHKVVGLWRRCHKESILNANDVTMRGMGCSNNNKVLKFNKYDSGLDLILVLHCGSILMAVVGLVSSTCMVFCKKQKASWKRCSILTASIVLVSVALGISGIGYNEIKYYNYKKRYARGPSYFFVLGGVVVLLISDAMLFVLMVCIRPRRKKVVHRVSTLRRCRENGEIEMNNTLR